MEDKNLDVREVKIVSCADPSPYITFAFACIAFAFWANSMGWLGTDATLAIGVMQLGFYGIYHVGTQKLSDTGNLFATNIYGIFAGAFAGVGGLSNVAAALCAHFGIPFCGAVSGIVFIASGILLLVLLPAVAHAPKTNFFVFLGGGIGCVGFGAISCGLLPGTSAVIFGWSLLVCGIAGMINVFEAFFSCFGMKVPTGKPFVKE